MFEAGGPGFFELMRQALSSTEKGYDLLADKFDLTPFRTPDTVVARSLSTLTPVDDALDLCCGTGAGLAALRPLTKRRLVGLDLSAGMLAQAQKRLATLPGPAAVEFIHQDVFAFDEQERFDLVTCYGALGHIPQEDGDRFFATVAHALRPGGRFVFVTAHRPSAFSWRVWVLKAFNAVMRVRNAFIDPPFIMYYLTFLLPEVVGQLERHGFTVELQENLLQTADIDPVWTRQVVVVATRR